MGSIPGTTPPAADSFFFCLSSGRSNGGVFPNDLSHCRAECKASINIRSSRSAECDQRCPIKTLQTVWSVIPLARRQHCSANQPIAFFTMHPAQNRQTLLERVAPSVNRSGFRNVALCDLPTGTGKVGSLAHWHRRLAVTGSPYCTRERRNCAGNWLSPMPTAASAGSCSSSRASTCWFWTILPCRR